MDITPYLESATIDWALMATSFTILVSALVMCRVLITYFNRRFLKHRAMVWLELTPPSSHKHAPIATEHFFSVLHGLRSNLTIKEKLLGRSPVLSLEIVSTRNEGIRFLMQVEKRQSASIQKAIEAYMPDAKVREITRALYDDVSVMEFAATKHFILPLKISSDQSDPLTYVTAAMTKLTDDEEITFQLITQPIHHRKAGQLSRRIFSHENILEELRHNTWPAAGNVGVRISTFTSGLTDLARNIYTGTAYGQSVYHTTSSKRTSPHPPLATHEKPTRTLSSFERDLMETMHRKVTQPLFQVDMRVLITSRRPNAHRSALKTTFDGFSVPLYQSLRVKRSLPLLGRLSRQRAVDRQPSVLQQSSLILAASELASLYHFPSSQINKTDNLISSLSKTLPAPASLKSNQELSVYIGENHHHGIVTPIGLTEAERERHMYIIGGTGNGKTTMLFYNILQDIRAGNGAAVVDPHGDLAERLLRYIPEDRINDVIYLNPDDLEYPIGMNLLELPEGLSSDELLREKDLVTEATISVLRKVFSDDDSGGHRIEYVLRNTIQTALTLEGSTLFTIFTLLNDAKYRRRVVRGLEDKNLRDFWLHEFGGAGGFQQIKMAAGITAKIGRFLFSASAKRILEQPKSTINFDDILASRKILICNFSKGMLGEDTSALFGTTVLAKLQTAALRRARVTEQERAPYYLYVDEFQNFATIGFVQMLSEARKYKLLLTMAEQSTSQQEQQRLVDIILANVGTVVSFRSGSPADERMILPLFSPYVKQGEIANLPAYSFYVRITAVHSQEPMSGVTLPINDDSNTSIARLVVNSSRKQYATKVEAKKVEKIRMSHQPELDKKMVPLSSDKKRKETGTHVCNDIAITKSIS